MSNIESTEMNDLLDNFVENIKIKFNSKIKELENKIIDLKDKNKILENTNTDFIKIIGYYQNKNVEKTNKELDTENKIFVKTNEELTTKIKMLEDKNLYLATTNIFLVKTNKDFEIKNKKYENYINTLEKKLNYNSNPKPSIPSVSVKPFTHDGVKYYKSTDNILYDKDGNTQGTWNEINKTIDPIIVEDNEIAEDEIEEEDSDSDEELFN